MTYGSYMEFAQWTMNNAHPQIPETKEMIERYTAFDAKVIIITFSLNTLNLNKYQK